MSNQKRRPINNILCTEKFQQWNQFQQINNDVSWAWNQSYNETFNLCCAGGSFNVTPHPMENTSPDNKHHFKTKSKPSQKWTKGGWGIKHEEKQWGAIYNKMFHLKSLVSYYRDLLSYLFDCFKLRNRDIRCLNGKKNTLLVHLPKVALVESIPQLTDELDHSSPD